MKRWAASEEFYDGAINHGSQRQHQRETTIYEFQLFKNPKNMRYWTPGGGGNHHAYRYGMCRFLGCFLRAENKLGGIIFDEMIEIVKDKTNKQTIIHHFN